MKVLLMGIRCWRNVACMRSLQPPQSKLWRAFKTHLGAHSTHLERTLDANRRAHSMPSPRKMLGVRLSGLQSLNLGPQISLHDPNRGQKYPNTLRPGKTSLNCHFGAEFVLSAPRKAGTQREKAGTVREKGGTSKIQESVFSGCGQKA